MEYWIPIAVLYAALISVIDIYKKWLLERQFDSLLILVQSQTIIVVGVFIYIPIAGIQVPFDLTLLGIGAITTLASWLLIEALKRDDVSVVGPVVSLTPLWVAFTEPLITDTGWEQNLIFGAVLVVAGVYLVLFEEDPLHPFRRLSDTGVVLAILGSFLYAGVAVFQSRLLDGTVEPLGVSLGTVIASWLFFAVLWLVLRGSPRRALDFHRLILPLAVFRLGTSVTFIRAVEGSDATTVEVIAQLSNLGSVAGGSLFGEEHLLKRGAGALLIVVAVFIVL